VFGREEWMDEAECLQAPDPNLFFPNAATERDLIDEARRYCWRCPVQDECLEYALKYKISDGIFAGLLPDQRRSILRRRSRESVPERH